MEPGKKILQGIYLDRGKHGSREAGMCLMEATAYIAGEPHSDEPVCVSPAIGRYGRSLNDELDDGLRQRLKEYIPSMIGTAGDGHDDTRSYMAVDWLVRTYTPAWLELAGRENDATQLRSLDAITSHPALLAAEMLMWSELKELEGLEGLGSEFLVQPDAAMVIDIAIDMAIQVSFGDTRSTSSPAIIAAVSVAGLDAHTDATHDPALGAAIDTVMHIVSKAAAAAAMPAAFAAAKDTVAPTPKADRITAEAAATAALAPTVHALQVSAIELLDRMCKVGR